MALALIGLLAVGILVLAERSLKHASANREATLSALNKAIDAKRVGWDAMPVSTARIYAELWPLIVNEDWCLASPSAFSTSTSTHRPWQSKPF